MVLIDCSQRALSSKKISNTHRLNNLHMQLTAGELDSKLTWRCQVYLTKRSALLGSLLLVATAIGGVAVARSKSHEDPVTVPESTSIHVTLDQALASNRSRPGDHFDATVAEPISVQDKVVIPQGARVEGIVVDARESGRLRGRARLQLALHAIKLDGKQYEIRTNASHRVGGNHKKLRPASFEGKRGIDHEPCRFLPSARGLQRFHFVKVK